MAAHRGSCGVCFKPPEGNAVGELVMYTYPDKSGLRKAYSVPLCQHHWDQLHEFMSYYSGEEDWYVEDQQQ